MHELIFLSTSNDWGHLYLLNFQQSLQVFCVIGQYIDIPNTSKNWHQLQESSIGYGLISSTIVAIFLALPQKDNSQLLVHLLIELTKA